MFTAVDMEHLEQQLGAIVASLRLATRVIEAAEVERRYGGIGPQGPAARLSEDLRLRSLEWRTFEHSAAVTRTYAALEGFVSDLVSQWLAALPSMYSRYEDLPDKVREAHRTGTARLMNNRNQRRYESITDIQAIDGYYRGISGSSDYSFLEDAFLSKDKNLRRPVVESIAASVGVENVWDYVENHRIVKVFLSTGRGTGEGSLESIVRKLVEFRNDAAHGTPDELLGKQQLMMFADAVRVVCIALSDAFLNRATAIRIERSAGFVGGAATEAFRKANAIILSPVDDCVIRVGQEVVVVGSNYCFEDIVASIQVNDQPTDCVFALVGQEIGVKFEGSRAVGKKSKIVLPRGSRLFVP